MFIQWSEEDSCFLVAFPDFPEDYWRTDGNTYEEAVKNGVEVLESLVEAYELTGDSLPNPAIISTENRAA